MKFSRLKIVGFKSFCDATELHLEPGLTGVVGPNGCGKSNLVEAMRWVMGESSYKAMRASGMDDVIFSGSGNRPGRNSAEVTLVLDNSDRTAPAALNNADVLEVTRRIERESGSQYRVNGREVRARDVQLLFADASTGAHSPALVRQGQIGELIAAKPVQRRALLEEAAGISGLHSRRHEAELRLRAADQNLERVDDIIAQVETQLDTLKRQARLATRYRNVSGDIRRAEATLYHIRWVAARFAEKEAEANQGKLINKLADATHAEHLGAKRLADADARMEPLRQAEAGAAAALQRLTILRDQLEGELRRANSRRAELEDRQKQLLADGERERTLVTESTELLEKYRLEGEALEKEAAGEAQHAEEARADFTNASEAVTLAEGKSRELADKLAQVRAWRQQAERALADAGQRAQRLKQQLNDVEIEANGVRASLDADEAVAERTSALGAAQELSAIAEKATTAAEAVVVEKQSALDELRPVLTESENQLSSLQSEATTLARVLNVEGGALWPPIVDALKVAPGYETALGAALGDDLEASSDSGAPIYWAEPGSPDSDAPLPAGATALTQHVEGPALLKRRLSQIGLIDGADGPKLMKDLKPGQRLVSIEGDLWRWDGFVAAADAPTAAAQRLSQRNRLAELDVEITAADQACAKLRTKVNDVRDGLEAARMDERAQRDSWREAQRSIASAQTGLDVAQKALTQLTSRQSALAEAKTRLTASLAEAQTAETETQKVLTDAGDESDAVALAEVQLAELAKAREHAEEARTKLSGFENAARLRSARQKQLGDDADSWQRRRTSAEAQLQTLDARGAEINEQLKVLDANPDGFAARRVALDEDIEAASADHKSASDRMAEAQTGFREADKAARETAELLSSIREELARIEERLKGFMAQRQQIEQMVQEGLSARADQTAEIAGIKPDAPLPEEDHVERRVERLKAERERLGGVNLGAEREADDVKEKLETMVTDRDDLIAAIAKLRTGISSLNREGRARLNEAFDKVNAHFQELFTSLFGGGTAELTFVESDDPLEAGLEIIARPPGKKPQTMTLLSGGEQALTALSLIFAVFLTNPAPICVLDEVDAPLDDANVERFCNLLDTMCGRTDTRFVVITHNPITMSRVDRLFGVTMAERGVSQLVSVDLQTAHAVAEAG